MVAVVDYGVGNLYSLLCSLRHIGAEAVVTCGEAELRAAERIILPGVGAFGDAAAKLRALGLDRLLRELAGLGKPLMGICLGMQLLFERGFEYGEHEGLGLIAGEVRPLAPQLAPGAKTPHMGWNSLRLRRPQDALVSGVSQGAFVYYVHSFYATRCEAALVADSDAGGVLVPGIVRNGNVCGTQFHPEKSGETGLRIVSAFVKGEATAC
ncbi:MAG: imidazole glycerol phosphate synthase subunit HisH [Clostridia bacterium]